MWWFLLESNGLTKEELSLRKLLLIIISLSGKTRTLIEEELGGNQFSFSSCLLSDNLLQTAPTSQSHEEACERFVMVHVEQTLAHEQPQIR